MAMNSATTDDPGRRRSAVGAGYIVTVFIAAYNAARYIDDAIDSVLAQTFTDFELLIIDDGSTDNTFTRLQTRARADSRIRLVRHDRNLGRAATRNHGLDIAAGAFIAMLDADDFCVPERLAVQLAFLERNPYIDVLGTLMQAIDDSGAPLNDNPRNEPGRDPDTLAALMLFKFPAFQGSVMARSRAFHGYRYDAAYEGVEDYDLWARMARSRRFALLPEKLTFYRKHPDQATQRGRSQVTRDSMAVHARELERIGVTYDTHDLEWDRLLRRGRQSFRREIGYDMGLDYARWARQWLESVLSANARSGYYKQDSFTLILAEILFFTCRKAARHGGLAVWRELVFSGLTRAWMRARVRAWFRPSGRMQS